MKEYNAIETARRGVYQVWQIDTDTEEEFEVEAHITAVVWVPDGVYGPEVFYVKEGIVDGDFYNADFLVPHHFSSLNAALIRIECLVEAGMVGFHYGF